MKSIISHEKVDAVIMAAWWIRLDCKKICDQDGNVLNMNGKISSDIAPIIHFQKGSKGIKTNKEWDPETVLVGFKLESDLNEEELFERAKIE